MNQQTTETIEITAESNPDIWAMLQPPEFSAPMKYDNPVDPLTDLFGSRLQYLSQEYTEFLLKCSVHRISSATPMSDLIESLDPDVLISNSLREAIAPSQ